jgi:hypothetical protein
MKFIIFDSSNMGNGDDPTRHQLLLRDQDGVEIVALRVKGVWQAQDRWGFRKSKYLNEAVAYAEATFPDVLRDSLEYTMGEIRGELEYLAREACNAETNPGTYSAVRRRLVEAIRVLDDIYGVKA